MIVQKNSPKSWLRPKFQSKSVYQSFRPIFIFSRCFALIPFSIETSQLGEVERANLTFLDLIWPCIATAIYLGLTVLSFFGAIGTKSDMRTTHILVIGDRLLFMFGVTIGTASITMNLINRNRLLWNIQQFEAFDKEVINSISIYSDD